MDRINSMYSFDELQETLDAVQNMGHVAYQPNDEHDDGLAFEGLFLDEPDLFPHTTNPGEHATDQPVEDPLYNTDLTTAMSANVRLVPGTPNKEDWEVNRTIITRLYAIEGKELKEVIQIMEQKYGFYATERQYRNRLKQWQIQKYVKSQEMLKVVQIWQRRELQGKDTVFFVRKRPVDRKNIMRFIKRTRDEVIATSPDWSTPPDIEYHTPRDMQSRQSQTTATTSNDHAIAGSGMTIIPSAPPQVYVLPAYMSNRVIHEANSAGHLNAIDARRRVQLALHQEDLAVLSALHSPVAKADFERSLVLMAEKYRADNLSPTQEGLPHPLYYAKPDELSAHPVGFLGHKMGEKLLLHLAIKYGQVALTLSILRHGSNSTFASRAPHGALLDAIHCGGGTMFLLLLLHGLDVDASGQADATMLAQARAMLYDLAVNQAANGGAAIVGFLYRTRILTEKHWKDSALWAALCAGQTSVFHELLHPTTAAVLDLDQLMEGAATIRRAIRETGPDAAIFLVRAAAGARLMSEEGGASALHLATALLLEDEVERLIRVGGGHDVNTRMSDGSSVLHVLSALADNGIADCLPLARALIAAGANVDARDANGDTCVHNAARYAWTAGRRDFIELLCLGGVDVNAQNSWGETALMVAAFNVDDVTLLPEAFQWFVDHGADADIKTPAGRGPREVCVARVQCMMLLADG